MVVRTQAFTLCVCEYAFHWKSEDISGTKDILAGPGSYKVPLKVRCGSG